MSEGQGNRRMRHVRELVADEPKVQVPAQVPPRLRSRQVKRTITRWRMVGAVAWAAVMLAGGIVGLLLFARPTTSSVEMRNLTEFPAFSVESFLDGTYFTDVSLWYADTYPLREPMVALDHRIDGAFGLAVDGAMVGGNVKADEIPAAEGSAGSVDVVAPADPPDERVVAADIQANIMDGLYIKDGAGYSIYYFDQQAADTYIAAMNTAASRLDGTATVYSIMSPANSIMLDPAESLAVGGSDQKQTLAYLDTRFDERVKSVELVDDIVAHRDEYLYFYTDHHWTQYGAYYAYAAFCKAKGIEPMALSERAQTSFGHFEGTYYDMVSSMGSPRDDVIDAYIPKGTNEMTYWNAEGEQLVAPIVDAGAADWDLPYKYSGFIQGDQPLEVIYNPERSDGSSCLVVKDSYGCAFVPLLVDSYEYVHVIDFRYTDKDLCDYARENQVQDVIFITGMKIGLTESAAATLLAEVSEAADAPVAQDEQGA